jgi:SPP1 family predicted phage head-tail adaptor
MAAGQLREKITLESLAAGQDATGASSGAWTAFATNMSASIRDLGGREYLAAQGVQNPVETEILIRYRPGVTAAMRVIHGSETYNIHAALDRDGRRTWLWLMCSRRQ